MTRPGLAPIVGTCARLGAGPGLPRSDRHVGLEFRILDAGHFALEANGDEIVRLMRDFLGKHVKK